jgi:hypothetical protein
LSRSLYQSFPASDSRPANFLATIMVSLLDGC